MNVLKDQDSTILGASENDEIAIEPERYELFEAPWNGFEIDRRGFLASVGIGLIVYLLFDREEIEAQESGGGRRPRGGGGRGAPSDVAAWLGIDADGKAKVLTGKIEVGQNIRTSLTQAVAEELRIAPEAITLVMGDTRFVPFDMGTFGSRTTPDMSRRLRGVAATARELLIDLAAQKWKVDRSELSAEDGKIVHKSNHQSATYGELTRGEKLVKEVSADPPTTPADRWTVMGKSLAKVDGASFVTGSHKYASDIKRPGMWYGKVLRAPGPGARAVSVDTTEAERIENVIVVRDGDFIGVVAADEPLANRALKAIKAEWKTVDSGVSNKNLYEELKKTAGESRGGGRDGGGGGSRSGAIDRALKEAEVKLEQVYTIAYIAHSPLEPRSAVAEWNDGEPTVWTGTQRPFGVRGEVATAFRLAEDKVRVIVPDTGAGYGGKHTGEAAVEAARLAKAAKRPVKLVWTREEEFTWAYFRPAGVIEVRSGATRSGNLTAWDFHNYNSGGSAINPPYEIAAKRAEFHASKSPLRQGSYRALAATANHFARETHVDELAHELKIDPIEFRLRNLKDERVKGVLEAAVKAFGDRKPKERGRGFGVAVGTDKGGYIATCVEVLVDRETGRVSVVRAVSAFDCGAVVNLDHLKNQVEGAMMMGIGGALFEEIEFDSNKILNARFSRYRVPRFADTPEIEVVLVDRKEMAPAGAGESPIVAIAPAIGNAIFQATGVRLRSLPLAPRGVKLQT